MTLMDLTDFTEWTKRMEYQGKLPEHMKIFFNAATSAIWGQIVEKIKPRQHVEKVRKCLVIHNLRSEEAGKGSKVLLGFPINEVEVWKKLQQAEKSADNLKYDIEDKDKRLKSVFRHNKAIYIKLENLGQKMKESEQKTYLYKEKSKKLQEEIFAAEEKLAYCTNLIQIEAENPQNAEISEDLMGCCNKLAATMKISNNFSHHISKNFQSSLYSEEIFGLLDQLEEEFEEFRQNGEFKGEAQRILSTYNKNLVWNMLRKLEENAKTDLNFFVKQREFKKMEVFGEKSMSGRLAELQSIHVQKEFEALSFALKCLVLERNLRNLEKRNYDNLRLKNMSETSIEEIKTSVQLRLEEVGLNTNLKALNEVLGELREGDNGRGLMVVLEKLGHQRGILNSSIRELSQKHKVFDLAQKSMLTVLADTADPVKRLLRFAEDYSWFEPLRLNLFQNELKIFHSFHLNLNRKYFYSKSEEFMREFFDRFLPFEEDLDSDLVLALADFLESPFQCPEATLLNVLQTKLVWKTLREIQAVPVNYQKQTYVLESLKSEENYLDYVMEKLLYLTRADVEKSWAESSNHLKEILDLWVEMPFKDVVSPTRLFNGENYKFYENSYDTHYNQLV